MFDIGKVATLYGEAMRERNACEALKYAYKERKEALYTQADALPDGEAFEALMQCGDELAELEDKAEQRQAALDELVGALSKTIAIYEKYK